MKKHAWSSLKKIGNAPKKAIIIFDGDGTLWYPKKTKYTEKPHWVYSKFENYLPHLIVTPTTIKTLRILRRNNVYTVLLSTHPQRKVPANALLLQKVAYLRLNQYFDEVIATRGKPISKKLFILRILRKLKISKSKALMVGDSYKWDYHPARQAGIEAVIFDSVYRKSDPKARKIKRVITRTKDILMYL